MERIVRLDYFRIILSLLVITMHVQPLFDEDSLTGWFISNGIARIAVPCFFILNGYFIYQKLDDKKALKRYLLHLLVVYIVWSVIYFPTYFQAVAPRSLITFAFMGYYHLWFLPALIVGLVILLITIRLFKKNDGFILLSAIILYFIGYIMESKGIYYRWFCNGVFFGYPFVALGYYIHKKNIVNNIKSVYIYLFSIIGLAGLFIQSYLDFGEEIYRNMFAVLIFLCPLLFILTVKRARSIPDKGYYAKTASGIYYIHILVLMAIIPPSDAWNIYKYPLIAIVSIVFSIFIIFVNKRIKIFL